MAQHLSRLRRAAVLGAALLIGLPAVAHAGPAAPRTLHGVLKRVVADPIGGGPQQHRSFVVTDAGASVDVPEALAGRIRSGTRVDVLTDATGAVVRVSGDLSPAGDRSEAGEHHLVLIPVYWRAGDTEASLPSNAEFTELVSKVDDYYNTSTNGGIRFTLDRITTPRKISVTSCDAGAIYQAAREIAGPTAHDRFHHLSVYFPNAECNWAGLADFDYGGTGDRFSWINGTTQHDVLAHELGHNLGLSHSDAYQCWAEAAHTTRVPLSDHCEVDVYGDIWDVMGANWDSGQMIAANLDRLGVLNAGGTRPVRSGEQVVIAPLSGGTGLRQVTFTQGTRTYYLEYRDAGGLDAPMAAIPKGLAVRFIDTSLPWYWDELQLITFHPAEIYPVLLPGEAWTGPDGTFSLTVGKPVRGGLPVTVELDTDPPSGDTEPPSAFALTAPADADDLASTDTTVSWSPVTDNTGVSAVAVLVDGTVAATVAGDATETVVSLPDGTHEVWAAATDAAGNTTETAHVTVTVDGSAPVGSPPPAATLQAGGTVSATAVPVKVSWGLTDAHGVARQRFARQTPDDSTARWKTLGPGVRETSSTTKPGTPARWQLDVADTVGHTATVVGDWTTTTLADRGSRYTGTWATRRGAGLLGGSEQTTNARNAAASYTFDGHAVGLVGTRSPQSGSFDIYLDGKKAGTFNAYLRTPRTRSLYYVVNFDTAGTHTIKVVNKATPGRPQLSLDAFAVLS